MDLPLVLPTVSFFSHMSCSGMWKKEGEMKEGDFLTYFLAMYCTFYFTLLHPRH